MPAAAVPSHAPRARRRLRRWVACVHGLGAGVLLCAEVWAADYTGRLIDAHAHLSSATAIETYVDAMKRHNVTKVVLLGVGGVQRNDAAWIAAAARKHPSRVIAGLPIPNPTSETAAVQLEAVLAKKGARVI